MRTENQPLDNQPQETDADDDFDAAFAEFAGGERDAEPDTSGDFEGGEEEGPEDEAPPGDGEEDHGAGGGGDLEARLKALEEENQRLKHSDSSQRGRLGAYQRQINELQRQMQSRQPPGQAQQPDQHGGQSPGSDDQQKQAAAEAMGLEDWEALKEDWPDMARALEARLEADRQERARLEREVAELRSTVQPIQQQAQEEHLRAQEDALTARHPDWREVVAAPAFAEWLNQQPESLQSLASSEDAAEAAALLDMYRVQAGPPAQAGSREGTPDKRQQRLAAAQTVGRRGAPRQGAVDDDFDAAFDHYAAKKAVR